jgi:hypothetical protein
MDILKSIISGMLLIPFLNGIKKRSDKPQITHKVSNNTIKVLLNIARDSDEHIIRKVEEALESKPRELEIIIQHRGSIEQDTVLILWEILTNRDKRTHLKVNVRSSLTDGVLLLVLMADSRVIRKHSYVMLEDPKLVTEPDFERHESERFSFYSSPSSKDAFSHDYLKVVELMNQYIEVSKVCGKRYDLEELLREYLLFPTVEEEEGFKGLLSGTLMNPNPVS